MDELTRLKKENMQLKCILKELGYIFPSEDINLTSNQKLKIYMNYFKGRSDIYATKYWSQKNNKYQYTFECSNKFKAYCNINKGKRCHIDCPHCKTKSLTPETIMNHIRKPNQLVGLYPLLEDNTCYLLALDFDDDLWFENMLSVYRIAKMYSISCVMERSQSGHGGHLWIFFKDALKASKARKLGDFLLKEAMNTNKNLTFKSFDRMFPCQDYHTQKGLGNMIVLPLQYDAMRHGNTRFINEFQKIIEKPFHYLMSINKITEEQIDQIFKLQSFNLEKEFNDTRIHLIDQITDTLNIEENSLLHISKIGLHAKTILTLRKISSIYNPEYFKKLNLSFSVYNTPRILCEYIEDDKEIVIPRGLSETLYNYIEKNNIIQTINTCSGSPIDITFKGSLRPNQQKAADTLLQHHIAILEAIPGFGKTIIALYIISALKINTLIIVNSKDLLMQWIDKINEFIHYPKSDKKKEQYIGEYFGNKKKLKGQIDIALIQSLTNINDMSIIQKYGLVIIDECHHASSQTYRNVLRNLNAKYIYSFSGTAYRSDKRDKILYMYLGPIVYRTNKKELIKQRTYKQILIPRFTTFRIIDNQTNFIDICNNLYQNTKRNHLIINDVAKEMKNNRNIIILTDRKEHIQILYNKLKYYEYEIYCISGDISIKKRNQIKEKLKNSHNYLIIATSQLLSEAFDLPSLNTMFITMPMKFKGRVSQSVGRLHREYDEKKYIYVYDYVDTYVKQLDNMFKSRLKTYKDEGYECVEQKQIVEFNQVIFDKSNYEYFLHSSMSCANKNVVIFTSEIKLNRIQKLYSFFISLLAKGIKVYICIHKDYDETIYHYLKGICTKIIHIDNAINAIMIDEKEIWNGSSCYLGIQNRDLYYVKTKDEYIIEELVSKISN